MLDIEKEIVTNMVHAMSIEEKIVAWHTLKEDEQLKTVINKAVMENPSADINAILSVARKLEVK